MREDEIRKRQGKRLAAARKAAGYRSAREAALTNNWAESTYRAHEGGTRTIGQDDAETYSRVFRGRGADITAQRILFEPAPTAVDQKQPGGRANLVRVPLLDHVAAGKLSEPGSQIPVEEVPLLAFADLGRGEFFALKVMGTSMDRLSPEGSTIIVNRTDKQLVSGRCYVFSVQGETTYKRWQGGDPPYLDPYSTDASHKPIFIKKKKDFEVIGRVRRTVLDL